MVPVLSNRLKACCQFVRPGDRVADVGCDHGYLGIFLLLSGVARSVIAADVNTCPLDSARRNGEKYAVADRMTFCLSDGVSSLPRDFDCLVCAGMGADTIISILSAAPWLQDSRYHFILQCQSKTPALRRYLTDQGYSIRRETLARDGKLPVDKMNGGTFTVTNIGAFGCEAFTPVINPPQTGILGVCNIQTKIKSVKDGAIETYPAMGLSLTFDHRVVDGAPAARFMQALCQNLENFLTLLAQ